MEMKTWFQKHADTTVVLAGILASVLWMNASIARLEEKITSLDKRITVIETILMLQGYNVRGIATNEDKK